ncbi:MAG: DegT/DnrJ/EryC1/StrS family aminotransferase [Acidobacteriota bacterium]|nr:DegT/DnrJ/EryC1/StrS family aminotransferase [Acidobacteriota bacterium]
MIPYFALDREFEALREPVLARVEEVFRSGQLLQGPWIADFEASLAAMTGRRHAVAVNSCTDALYFALASLRIGAADEVLVPDFSFAATASSVLRTGAVPVYVDVGEGYELDLDHAAELVSDRTKALVHVDLYGRMGDAAALERFAAAHGLALVEDAAQTLGGVRDGRPAGSAGVASCFSFDPTKVVSAPGSGGALLTDDDEIAWTVRTLKGHGKSPDGTFDRVGQNAQMSSIVAAVLSVKLEHEEEWLRARQRVAAAYTDALSGREAIVPERPADREHVFHKYVVRVSGRDAVQAALRERGVATLVHYPTTLSALPFAAASPRRGGGERAARFAREVLSLPVHPHLRDDEIARVCAALAETVP